LKFSSYVSQVSVVTSRNANFNFLSNYLTTKTILKQQLTPTTTTTPTNSNNNSKKSKKKMMKIRMKRNCKETNLFFRICMFLLIFQYKEILSSKENVCKFIDTRLRIERKGTKIYPQRPTCPNCFAPRT